MTLPFELYQLGADTIGQTRGAEAENRRFPAAASCQILH